jgi:hypothetical protein
MECELRKCVLGAGVKVVRQEGENEIRKVSKVGKTGAI